MENDAQLPFVCRGSSDMIMGGMTNCFWIKNHLPFVSDVLSVTSNVFPHPYPWNSMLICCPHKRGSSKTGAVSEATNTCCISDLKLENFYLVFGNFIKILLSVCEQSSSTSLWLFSFLLSFLNFPVPFKIRCILHFADTMTVTQH